MNQSVTATNYWSAQLDELFLTSGGSCDGLATVTATGHLLRHGRNTLLADDRRSKALRLFMDRFRSLPVLILVIALILRAWLDALIVPAVVFITAVLSFIQAFHAIHAAAMLRQQVSAKATVPGGGHNLLIPYKYHMPAM